MAGSQNIGCSRYWIASNRQTAKPQTYCHLGHGRPAYVVLASWTAPVFSKTLADLVNLSFSTSLVPTQWKRESAQYPKQSDWHIRVTSARSPSLMSCHGSQRRCWCVTSCTQHWAARRRHCALRTSTISGRAARLQRHWLPSYIV